jgi:hypothetical protein
MRATQNIDLKYLTGSAAESQYEKNKTAIF